MQDPNQSQVPDSSSDVRNRNRIKLEMEVKQEPWESEVGIHIITCLSRAPGLIPTNQQRPQMLFY